MTLCLCSTRSPILLCALPFPPVLQILPASSRADFSVACFSFFLDGLLFVLPHVLTVINLTGINEIYVANTLCQTKMLHSSRQVQRCQIYRTLCLCLLLEKSEKYVRPSTCIVILECVKFQGNSSIYCEFSLGFCIVYNEILA